MAHLARDIAVASNLARFRSVAEVTVKALCITKFVIWRKVFVITVTR